MVTGWRRAFCTSIPKERDTPGTVFTEKSQQQHCSNNQSPRFSSKFSFFSNSSSNPSTPRLQSRLISTSSLRCKTTTTATNTPISSVPNSPKLHCKTTTPPPPPQKKTHNSLSPRLFHFSNPSSPKSPSSFSLSLIKSSLRLSKTKCGICLHSVKSGQGTAVFTGECSHSFHFSCISTRVKKQQKTQLLICPVCNAAWKELPVLEIKQENVNDNGNNNNDSNKPRLRVYNDDEPLMSSPISLAHFNPIPESEEEFGDDEDDNESHQEFQGFFVTNNNNNSPTPPLPLPLSTTNTNVQLSLLPESVVVSLNRSQETHVLVLKIRAPPSPAARGRTRGPASVDLVTVLDVSGNMSGVKMQMLKRAMRLVVSGLGSTDRLSIVAFSSSSKRLLPLRRMTANGRRSARRIVDALGCTGQGMNLNDAVKKAVKVLEDRRERNTVSRIIVLSDGYNYNQSPSSNHSRSSWPLVSTARSSHLDIPVHIVGFGNLGAYNNHAPTEDALAKCVAGLLSVVVHDLRLQIRFGPGSAQPVVAAVYSLAGKPASLGSGSIRVGDMYAEEERELLIELTVPNCCTTTNGAHHFMFVRSSLRDPLSQELIPSKEQSLLLPRALTVRSSSSSNGHHSSITRLRNLHVSTRAVAESRRLIEHNDLSGAYHLLTSARALLVKSAGNGWAEGFLHNVEAELAELQQRQNRQRRQQRVATEEKAAAPQQQEQLTPTSAWRAAERLAKVAIMRKHMNRVSDLHGFENARF